MTGCFEGFTKPYFHVGIEEYRRLAEENDLRVVEITPGERSWDFGTRKAFHTLCRAMYITWTRWIPEADRDRFIQETLDRYQVVAANNPAENNTFKFYMMKVVLTPS